MDLVLILPKGQADGTRRRQLMKRDGLPTHNGGDIEGGDGIVVFVGDVKVARAAVKTQKAWCFAAGGKLLI